MKKRRRQRFLSLMLVLCMIASAGMMTPLSTSADSTDVNLTEETQQAESALTGGAAADQMQAAAADTETDLVSVTQNQETMTAADTQTADSGAVWEEAAAPAAEQTNAGTGQTGAGTEQSDPAVTESANLTETPSESQAAEGKTKESADGMQGTVNTETPAADEEQKTEQKQDSEETEVSWPAQTFTGYANNITVNVTAAAGVFPEGTTMVTTAVSAQTAKAIANAASDAESEVVDAIGVDISFRDASGNEIEPKDGKNVQVRMTVDAASTLSGDNFSVVHQSDDGNVQKVTENATAEGAVFESGEFSIYVITGEGAEQKPAIATYHFHDADGNEIISAMQKVKNGETVYAPTTPKKAGSKFLGWSYTPGVSSIQEGDPGEFGTLEASVSTTGEVVHLYPVFQEAYYVFFLDNQGRVSTTKEGASGDVISVEDVVIPLDSTHSVTGWYTEAELTNKVESVMLSDHNVTLYPKVEEGHYLYFSSGEGASYVKPVFVAAGKNTVKPEAPTRPGYTFKHWSASEGGSEYAFGSTISEDTTLHAVWEANLDTQYTVIYWWENANDANYSYHENRTATGQTGSTIDLTKINKSYDGFTLNKEKTDAANKDITIAGDGSTIVNVYYFRNTYEIKFYKGEWQRGWFGGWFGGSYSWYEMTGLRISAKYGANISNRWPTKTSKIWGTQKGDDGQGEAPYQSGISTMPLNGAAFYYVSQTGSYTMNLHYNLEGLDGTYSLHHTDSFKSDSNKWVTTAEDHYDIEGFTYTNNVKDGSRFERESRNVYDVYEVSFKYSRNSYSINFVNGSSKKSKTFKYGADVSKVDLKADPERPVGIPSAYVFAGWFDNELGVGDPATLTGTMPAHDITLYAKWKAPTCTAIVHTMMDGTDDPIKLTINYGSKINENDMPMVKDAEGNVIREGSSSNSVRVPEGYKWAGWGTKEGDNFIVFNFNTVVDSDITLYPYYINGAEYVVTYKLGDGSGTEPTDSKLYAENSYADIQPATGVTPPEGKTFLYWRHGTDKYYPGDKILVTDNLTLFAVYGDPAKTTSLTYDSNYPTESVLEPMIKKQSINGTETLQNNVSFQTISPTGEGGAGFGVPDGYYFAGWNTSKDGQGTSFGIGDQILVDDKGEPNTLYAQWKKKQNVSLIITGKKDTVTYNGKNHSVSGYSKSFEVDGKLTEALPGNLSLNERSAQAQAKTASGKDAKTYYMGLTALDFSIEGSDLDKYNISVIVEDGYLKIEKRKVTLTSESDTKAYDGTALTAPNVTVGGGGFVDGEVTDLKATGTIITVGSVTNTIAYTEGTSFNAENYEITKKEGTLAITANAAAIEVKADSDSKTYDGRALTKSSFGVTGLPEGFAAEATVTGSITDAGTTDNVIASVVIKKGNENVTDQFSNITKANGTLTIIPRKVILTSGSVSKDYDGTALTKPEVKVSGDGFVAGEVSDVKATGSITKTGSVTNTITFSENKGFKTGNYEITKTEGKLTITANTAAIKVTADSDSKTYDGTPLTKNTYKIEGLPEGFTEKVTVSGTITDAGSAVNEVKSVVILKDGKDVTDQFTNIKTASGTLTVNKRTVNLKSDSASKAFDGTALTAPTVTVADDGFVTGEVADLKAVGTITKVGSVKNEIRYTEKSGFKADNYTIIKDEGKLTITQNANEIVVNAENASKTYDGTALTESGSEVIGLPEGYTAEVTVSGSITDAGTAENKVTSVVIRKGDEDVTDQFKTITKNNGTLTVTKRNVTLTSESQNREYNGTALTAPNVTVGGDGFVDGEVTDLKATGSITDVGSTENTITYTKELGKFKEKNYVITENPGTLTINKNTTAVITFTAADATKEYDGTALTASDVTVTGLPEGFTAEGVAAGSIVNVWESGNDDNRNNPVVKVAIYNGDRKEVTGYFKNVKKVAGILTITPKSITLKSGSATKPFDGEPLTNHTLVLGDDIIRLTMLADKNDLTISDDDKLALGIAEKDQITFNFTGSQTLVGSSANTFEYTISEKAQTRVQPSLAEALKMVDPKEEEDKVSKNYAENYEISLEFGELEVTDNEVTPTPKPETTVTPTPKPETTVTPTPKPETTVTPTPVPVKPEEPKPEEPTQPEKPVITPQATVTPTPLVTVPPTELPSTRPVHTGNTIRKNPDTIQERRTKLVHTGAVRTGDAGMIGVNVIIVLGAAAGIGVLIRRRRKEKKQ